MPDSRQRRVISEDTVLPVGLVPVNGHPTKQTVFVTPFEEIQPVWLWSVDLRNAHRA